MVDSSDAEFSPVNKPKHTIETHSKALSPIKLPILPARMFSSSSRSASPSSDLEIVAVKLKILAPTSKRNSEKNSNQNKHQVNSRDEKRSRRRRRSRSRATDGNRSRHRKHSRSRSRKPKRRSRRRSDSRERRRKKREKSPEKRKKSPAKMIHDLEEDSPYKDSYKEFYPTSKDPKFVLRRLRVLFWKHSISIRKELSSGRALCLRIITKSQYEKVESLFDQILSKDGVQIRAIAIRNTFRQQIGRYYELLIQLEQISQRKAIARRISDTEAGFEMRNVQPAGIRESKSQNKSVNIPKLKPEKKKKKKRRQRKVVPGPTEEQCENCEMTWRGIRRTCPRCGSNKIVNKKKIKSKLTGETNDSDSDSSSEEGISYF